MQEEATVGLFEDRARTRFAEGMAAQAPGPMGIVQLGEEQRLAVVGPGHAAVTVGEGQGGQVTAAQVLDVQRVDFIAAGVEAVGQSAVVRADAERAQRQEASVGQGIGVEQQLFLAFIDRVGVVRRAWAAVVARVLVACGGAGVVEVGAPGRGQRQVGFENAALDLFEQLLAQRCLVGQAGFLIGVFRLQVIEHFLGVALLQPGVGISGLVLAGNGGLRFGWHRGSLGRDRETLSAP